MSNEEQAFFPREPWPGNISLALGAFIKNLLVLSLVFNTNPRCSSHIMTSSP